MIDFETVVFEFNKSKEFTVNYAISNYKLIIEHLKTPEERL